MRCFAGSKKSNLPEILAENWEIYCLHQFFSTLEIEKGNEKTSFPPVKSEQFLGYYTKGVFTILAGAVRPLAEISISSPT